jgi:hypothetical protein
MLAAAVMVAGATIAPSAQSTPLPYPWSGLDDVFDCYLPATPAAVAVPVVDDDTPITVDLYLVLDRGIAESRARAVIAMAQESYTPLGITLRVVGLQKVRLEGTEAQPLIDQTTDLFPDGERPKGSDAVVTFTSVDIEQAPIGNGVMGLAGCIGGVRYPDRSFLVAEVPGDAPAFAFGGVSYMGNTAAKVVAHELGHLLGAHHHFANCAEGVPSEAAEGEASPCTLMSNFADFDSINFGTFEAAVVRGHADAYARP